MKTSKSVYLSYILDDKTPTYGNRNKFSCVKKSDISRGDVTNDSMVDTTVHIGTHVDMPYHFFDDGQTVDSFDADFFTFKDVLYIEIKPKELLIKEELLSELEEITHKSNYTFLLVKTGICAKRDTDEFWKNNYGFDPLVAVYIREKFPNIRIMGFDSISVSSFAHRMIGREAHKAFLDPRNPILLLEDMDLNNISKKNNIAELIVAPLRIDKCDGLPCTVIAKVN